MKKKKIDTSPQLFPIYIIHYVCFTIVGQETYCIVVLVLMQPIKVLFEDLWFLSFEMQYLGLQGGML